MGFFLVLRAELARSFIIMRRYWFATIISISLGYGVIMALIYAFLYDPEAAGKIAERAGPGSLGFILGMLAFGIIGIFSQGLQGMARTGELEQVCMSPHGLVTNFLARSLVSSITTIFSLSILFALIARSVGSKVHFDAIPVITVLFLTYVNMIGFGFMTGGLVLVFKQIGQVVTFFRLGLMFLVTFATSTDIMLSKHPLTIIAHMLPVVDAAICMKSVLFDGIGMGVFTHTSMFWLLANCIVWTTLGIACFRYMENISRDKGTLGAY